MVITIKKCKGCSEAKNISLFNKNSSARDGLQHCCRACTKSKRKRYPEKTLATSRIWRAKNIELLRKRKIVYNKKYLAADPIRKLRCSLRSRLHGALRGNHKAGSAVADLGCSIAYFKSYLESQFKPGMSWDNRGIGKGKWHIDHIMPLAAFNLEDRQHFVLAVHYGNLQPLWFEENMSKGHKVPDLCLSQS